MTKMIKELEEDIRGQLYLLDDRYRYVEEDEDGNISCGYDRLYGSNHFKLEEYQNDVDCLYRLQAQLEIAKKMLNVFEEFNKKMTYRNIHIFLENNKYNDDVLSVIVSFLTGISDKPIKEQLKLFYQIE